MIFGGHGQSDFQFGRPQTFSLNCSQFRPRLPVAVHCSKVRDEARSVHATDGSSRAGCAEIYGLELDEHCYCVPFIITCPGIEAALLSIWEMARQAIHSLYVSLRVFCGSIPFSVRRRLTVFAT